MSFSASLPFKAATLSAWLVGQPKVRPKIMASVQQINKTSNRKTGLATGLTQTDQSSKFTQVYSVNYKYPRTNKSMQLTRHASKCMSFFPIFARKLRKSSRRAVHLFLPHCTAQSPCRACILYWDQNRFSSLLRTEGFTIFICFQFMKTYLKISNNFMKARHENFMFIKEYMAWV